jgi:hypothetical protein
VKEKKFFLYEIFVLLCNGNNLEGILSRVAVIFVNKTVLRNRDVYPGSEFFHPDAGSRVKKAPDLGSRILDPQHCNKMKPAWHFGPS